MKKILLSIAILGAVVGLGACKKSDNTPANNANVMFVNGCAGTVNISVTENSTAVPGATNLPFLSNSGYQNLPAGTDNIAFILTSTGTQLLAASTTFSVNQHYSMFLGGLVNNSPALMLSDDLTPPASGFAKIRLINLSHDTLSLTGNAGSTAFATGVSSMTGSSFTTITAGTYTIKAGDPSNINSVVSAASQTYGSGKIYTAIYTGASTGTLTSALTLSVINNY